MDIHFTEVVASIERLTNGSQHEKYAQQNMLIASTGTMQLLAHYTELKIKRPQTYLEDIISGKMATLFKKALDTDPQSAKDIYIIAKLGPNLLQLTKAVQAKNILTTISAESAEHAAMSLIRSIMEKSTGIAQIRTRIKEKIETLSNSEELEEIQIATLLTANYMQ